MTNADQFPSPFAKNDDEAKLDNILNTVCVIIRSKAGKPTFPALIRHIQD